MKCPGCYGDGCKSKGDTRWKSGTANEATAEKHACPALEDMNGDDSPHCNCCEDCQIQCAEDV